MYFGGAVNSRDKHTHARGRSAAAGNTNCLVQQGKHGPLVRLMDGQTTTVLRTPSEYATDRQTSSLNLPPALTTLPFILLSKTRLYTLFGPRGVDSSVCPRCLKPCESLTSLDSLINGVPENSSVFH